ncbi:hypothetical protein RFI_19784, partial [Reticulomyxa filosa]
METLEQQQVEREKEQQKLRKMQEENENSYEGNVSGLYHETPGSPEISTTVSGTSKRGGGGGVADVEANVDAERGDMMNLSSANNDVYVVSSSNSQRNNGSHHQQQHKHAANGDDNGNDNDNDNSNGNGNDNGGGINENNANVEGIDKKEATEVEVEVEDELDEIGDDGDEDFDNNERAKIENDEDDSDDDLYATRDTHVYNQNGPLIPKGDRGSNKVSGVVVPGFGRALSPDIGDLAANIPNLPSQSVVPGFARDSDVVVGPVIDIDPDPETDLYEKPPLSTQGREAKDEHSDDSDDAAD